MYMQQVETSTFFLYSNFTQSCTQFIITEFPPGTAQRSLLGGVCIISPYMLAKSEILPLEFDQFWVLHLLEFSQICMHPLKLEYFNIPETYNKL